MKRNTRKRMKSTTRKKIIKKQKNCSRLGHKLLCGIMTHTTAVGGDVYLEVSGK